MTSLWQLTVTLNHSHPLRSEHICWWHPTLCPPNLSPHSHPSPSVFVSRKSNPDFLVTFSKWTEIKSVFSSLAPNPLCLNITAFCSSHVKSLGVILDIMLSFQVHINNIPRSSCFHLRNVNQLCPCFTHNITAILSRPCLHPASITIILFFSVFRVHT